MPVLFGICAFGHSLYTFQDLGYQNSRASFPTKDCKCGFIASCFQAATQTLNHIRAVVCAAGAFKQGAPLLQVGNVCLLTLWMLGTSCCAHAMPMSMGILSSWTHKGFPWLQGAGAQ